MNPLSSRDVPPPPPPLGIIDIGKSCSSDVPIRHVSENCKALEAKCCKSDGELRVANRHDIKGLRAQRASVTFTQ